MHRLLRFAFLLSFLVFSGCISRDALPTSSDEAQVIPSNAHQYTCPQGFTPEECEMMGMAFSSLLNSIYPDCQAAGSAAYYDFYHASEQVVFRNSEYPPFPNATSTAAYDPSNGNVFYHNGAFSQGVSGLTRNVSHEYSHKTYGYTDEGDDWIPESAYECEERCTFSQPVIRAGMEASTTPTAPHEHPNLGAKHE